MKKPVSLAIDTSCDETSASVVEGQTVLSNIQPSQMKYHKKFGGVVPNLARLAHQERIYNVVELAMKKAGKSFSELDFISVTEGPGLAIALEVGIKKAKDLAIEFNKPLYPVNHMEGHLLSGFAKSNAKDSKQGSSIDFPAIGILVSGGHTELILVNSIGDYKKIGETLDDSCGECLDKSGRMLGLGYPAGPVISEFSKQNRENIRLSVEKNNQSLLVVAESKKTGKTYKLPVSMWNSGDLNFSYSGLKTAFRQLVESITTEDFSDENRLEADRATGASLKRQTILDLSVLIEEAAYYPLELKLKNAIEQYGPKEIWGGGGVFASARLKSKIRKIAKENNLKFRVPYTAKITTDNAAMIGIVTNLNFTFNNSNFQSHLLTTKPTINSLDRDPSLSL